MKRDRRAIVITLDSVGIGALPDAADYGDAGADTLGHLCGAFPPPAVPQLAAMGLGNLKPLRGIPPAANPTACFARLGERSAGKDTITGHWELMGLVTPTPFPTYPEGFPPELMGAFETAIGRKTLGNVPASGTQIIRELGEAHLRTGFPIVYTSADSVFQIAAHEVLIPVEELYAICRAARKLLVPPHGVSRVIARPFIGKDGQFTRTARRRDFSVPPHGPTLPSLLHAHGYPVAGIGKVRDIFAGVGLTRHYKSGSNQEGMNRTLDAMGEISSGLILANLVDFDMLYGHRKDLDGYLRALEAFDRRLPEIRSRLRPNDLLAISADHGCDPTMPGTDHTREYVPLLIQGDRLRCGVDLGTRESMADLGASLQAFFGLPGKLAGRSFLKEILVQG